MRLALILVFLLPPVSGLCISNATQITFTSGGGGAAIEPFSIDEPQSGLSLTVAPAIVFSGGSFQAVFDDLDSGATVVRDYMLNGSLDIDVSTVIELGPFPIPVTATISGPLSIEQTSDSTGSLVAATAYVETAPGDYNVSIGPLDCSDSAFGVVCGALETALSVEFPLEGQAFEGAALPFTGGTFENLNQAGGSSAGIVFDFSFPIGGEGGAEVGATADLEWAEVAREIVVVPEPSAALFLVCAAFALGSRYRRRP